MFRPSTLKQRSSFYKNEFKIEELRNFNSNKFTPK